MKLILMAMFDRWLVLTDFKIENKLTKYETTTKRQNKPKMKLKHGLKLTLCSAVNHEERKLCRCRKKKCTMCTPLGET